MKIGIISDTHGCPVSWKKAYDKFFYDADLIIHAGDVLYHGPRNNIPSEYNPKQLVEILNNCKVPIIIACGNCDAEIDSMVLELPIQAPYACVHMENIRIIINHGHNLTEEQKKSLANKYKADLFITGHTHIANLDKQGNTIFLNPGSPSMSKREDKQGTVALLLDNKVIIYGIDSDKELMSAAILS